MVGNRIEPGAWCGMPTRPSKREDALQAAARIVEQTTGQPLPKLTKKPEISEKERKLRSQAASILGKLGGSKGGKARAAMLSSDQRADIARRAALARWKRP